MTGDYQILNNESYVELRNSLICYLRRLGSSSSEDLADEAILRVLKSLKRGEAIQDLCAYGIGVAHNVYLESIRGPTMFPLGATETPERKDYEAETLDQCLTSCLKTLTKRERQIVKGYYLDTSRSLIECRRRLSKKLGMTPNALRLEVHRIRKRLGECIESCADNRKKEK